MADIVFINGKIITVDKNDTVVEAVAVDGKHILKTGTNKEMESYIDSHTKVIDLAGRSMVPGFIDSHIHFMMYSLYYKAIIDIAYDKVQSIAGIKEIIKKEAAEKKPGEWIYLWGYDQNKLLEKRHPTIQDLDEAAPDNPVLCVKVLRAHGRI